MSRPCASAIVVVLDPASSPQPAIESIEPLIVPTVVRNPEPVDPAVMKGMWGTGTSNVAHLIVNDRY